MLARIRTEAGAVKIFVGAIPPGPGKLSSVVAPGSVSSSAEVVPHGNPHPITFVYPYYENPQTLAGQVERWSAYPGDIRRQLLVVVVDDGSPETPAEEVLRGQERGFDLQLFRIEVDVRWNWLAARNIGMHHAPETWCLLTDMDHVVPVETARSMVFGRFEEEAVYRLSREENNQPIYPHPNSWWMSRATYWRVGGYDEALSGLYGTDRDYRKRVAKSVPLRMLADRLIRNEHERDASTTRYLRDQPEDADYEKIVAERGEGWRPRVLSFPYHRVSL